jgi:hypothetical protein
MNPSAPLAVVAQPTTTLPSAETASALLEKELSGRSPRP